MSYNKPEKEFGEAPKVHKIRTSPAPMPYENNAD